MIILEGKHIEDRASLHAALKSKLNLPEYYGGNLDALHDCLEERRERELFVIQDFPIFSENLEGYGYAFLKVLADSGIQVLLD